MVPSVDLRPRTEIRQDLTINHQAIQAIQILEYSQEELETFLQDALARNPLLKETEQGAPMPPVNRAAQFSAGSRGTGSGETPDLSDTVAAQINLYDHLHRQLGVLRTTPELKACAASLIDSLEPDGYLRTSLEDLADILEISPTLLEEALALLQSLEPAGIAARDLAECLEIQLRSKAQLTPVMTVILRHLHLIERGEIERLARLCKLSIPELTASLDAIRQLNPRPGLQFNTEPTQPALPDILVHTGPEGRIRVELNPELLPRILVDRSYYTELSAQIQTREEDRFLQDCLREANTLVHHLDQRMHTILRIARVIVQNQADFLFDGASGLRPLLQKEVARAAGVHESTVSRTVANKYLLCSQGLLPLKNFFSTRIGDELSPGALSAAAIRQRIKTLLEQESADDILSDDAIVRRLQADGVDIARRTVAKYRQQLRIPSSAQRRRQRRLPWNAVSPTTPVKTSSCPR